MNFVNRISLIITPKIAMHQWIVDTLKSQYPTFEELSNESSCYLFEEPTQDVDISNLKQSLITNNFQKIWENELSVWDEFQDNFPTHMNEQTFKQWFNVTLSGLTFDLSKTPLMTAPVE